MVSYLDVQKDRESSDLASQEGSAHRPSVATIRQDFLLKQIENEISAGFAFVDAARRALRRQQDAEADHSLRQALDVHQKASEQASVTPLTQIRSLTGQLAELREAIDWLRETTKPAGA